jgi:hypothetical protein
VEPQNTGINHPTNIYIPIGHGGERVGEKHVVPKGCILVVKAHSGDITLYGDVIRNAKAILNVDNKGIVFDPVSHKKELFSLLNSKDQSSIRDLSASNSTAIYREGDRYNNFSYQLFNKYPDSIGTSGIISLQHSTTDTDFKEIDKEYLVNYDAKVFDKDTSGNYIYSTDVISSLFSNSDAYTYFYTQQHIQDTLTFILVYLNLQKDGYTRIVSSQGKAQERVILDTLVGLECLDSVSDQEIEKFKALESRNIKDDPRNKWIACLSNITLKTLCDFITSMTSITQADLFKDVKAGLIKPGIFYNLICRKTEGTSETYGLLNTQYIDNSDHHIRVRKKIGEVKNRISEATLQRKPQAREVFRNATAKNYKKVNGRWVENIPASGGKRKTRKNRRRF